jgi:hypothetical protein
LGEIPGILPPGGFLRLARENPGLWTCLGREGFLRSLRGKIDFQPVLKILRARRDKLV